MARILIVDDEENIRKSLKSALDKRDHTVVTAADCNEARSFLPAGFDLVILDVRLPDGDGVELLGEIRAANPRQQVVIISGHADIDIAVTAIHKGAYDFLEKPLSLDRILVTIDNATRANSLITEKERLSAMVYGDLIGESAPMKQLQADITRSAARASRFLLLGENGTGKELVAYLIHLQSRFSGGSFVAVNCAALPSELVESELFGHRPGAFTGATKSRKGKFLEADNGTIFLDEISEMSLAAQAKILRVLENREITPVGADSPLTIKGNVITASNRDLDAMVKDNQFRQDLFYRLNVVTLTMPPLRERPSDIPLLANHFLSRFAEESGEKPITLSKSALRYLQTLDFPGNVRELRNLMERVNIYCDSDQRDAVNDSAIRALMPLTSNTAHEPLKKATERFEYEYIRAALIRNNDNYAQTARELGLERSHLYKKLKKLERD